MSLTRSNLLFVRTIKLKTLFFSLFTMTILNLVPCHIASPAFCEVMDAFRSDIKLEKDATIDVLETIQMNFGNEERHGIRRHIPVVYRRYGNNFTVEFNLISVTDGKGRPINFNSRRNGRDVEIKIGDPDLVVHGKQIYKIKYTVRRVINWFENQPEFYWNVTGTDTPFAIRQATAVVVLPPGVDQKNVRVESFEGTPGATEPAQSNQDASRVVFRSRTLEPDEGLTIAIRLPQDAIIRPSKVDELIFWLKDWFPIVLIPLATAMLLFARWSVSGKDQGQIKVVAVDWEPPKGLSPAEVGTLVDEKCDLQDVTSTLIDLAVRGYLKIKKVKVEKFVFLSNNDYEFTRTAPPDNSPPLNAHEQRFLDGLFSSVESTENKPGQVIWASSLKYSFYPYITEIKNLVYSSMVDKQLFFANPESVRSMYYTLAVAVLAIGLLMFFYSLPAAAGFIIAGVMCALVAPAMPGRTKDGADLTRQALGFKRFVKMAEKDRIKVLASEDPTIFGRLLPYAMVLGAADQWANAFKDLALAPPDWYYSDDYASDFSTNLFINDLGNSVQWFAQTMSLPPAQTSSYTSGDSGFGIGSSAFSDSGGGGSVDGGFGGGGTDSW